MLGFKQKAILNEFYKRKKLTVKAVSRFYGFDENRALNTLKTLEVLGYIRLDKKGIWRLKDI